MKEAASFTGGTQPAKGNFSGIGQGKMILEKTKQKTVGVRYVALCLMVPQIKKID